ncbi:MAG TPA: hypothetical protein VMZ03_12675 [Chitinophagaceae bacterium]|nr:hypothetical protein [Chitinophagaceae bacterium]
MRWLLFLSRLAFISGVCIVVWLVLAMMKKENDEVFSSTIITIGYVMGALFLPLVNICYLVVALSKRRLRSSVPLWLITCNLLFLFVLIFYIFYLNDPYYNQ